MACCARNLVAAFDSRQHRDRSLSAVEGQGMSVGILGRVDESRATFNSRILTAIVASALLAGATAIGPSPAFAEKRGGEACKAAFMNKCLADCRQRAGRQCDWFCGRRSTYTC
jgi:hypothetical protein